MEKEIIIEIANDFKNQIKDFDINIQKLEKDKYKILEEDKNYKYSSKEWEYILAGIWLKNVTKIEEKQYIINIKKEILQPILEKAIKELEEQYIKIVLNEAKNYFNKN